MADRPRVGVTGNDWKVSPAWWCTRLALLLTGAVPERISVRRQPTTESLDALVIGGGDNISPEHYGGEIHARVKSNPERDRLEIHWIEKALERNLPLLGICRGAQLINVVLGGSLHQDIRPMRRHTRNRPGLLPTKQVQLEGDSRLAEICGRTQLRVNSLHHQAIREIGTGLRAVGRDRDHIVQAVESPDRAIIGVQWHPEYLIYLPSQLVLFRRLVTAVR